MNETAIVIGAGANELVAAHVLARGGRRVIVFEGSASSSDAADVGWVPPRIARDLGLEQAALTTLCADPWASAPLPGGGRLELWRDMARSVEAIGKVSARDAARWPEFCERMRRLGRLLETIYLQPPPALTGRSFGDLAQMAGLGLRARRLGRQGIEDLLRLIPMSAADLLDEWFETDALKGILGAAGVMNLCQGPRSGGTAYRLLHRHVGSPVGVFRPPLSNIGRVLRNRPGVDIRAGAKVEAITVREGRAAGVVLAGGEEIPAGLVVSGADPQRTLLTLADPAWLDPELVRAVRNIRSRGIVARVTLAFDRAPGWSTLVVAPSLDYIERAYDDAKYGRVSLAPYVDARRDGQTDGGRHRLDVKVQYVPYALAAEDWNDERRVALGAMVVRVLSRHTPDLGAATVERVLLPVDFENAYGWPEGQEEQAEPALDQLLWMRPVPELARYRTPIGGLYLCGAGMHPGGGIAGAAGYNAAREIFRDLRAR
jgi:phytoene dehydrogenase-like protein